MAEQRPLPFLHRYATPLQVLLTLGLYVQLSVLAGIATAPGAYLSWKAWQAIATWSPPLRILTGCVLLWGMYFAYAICVIFVVPAFRFLTRAGTPLGTFSYYSFKGYQWASYNALILLVRYTCINFMRVTPLINLFHGLMGMKVGKRVQINTAIIGDSNLIEIGDDTVIGGDVTLVGHAAEHGNLVTAPVRIGNRVTVGLMAIIFPGVTIGDGAMIAANALLPKGTQVAPNEVWGGIPAKKLGERRKKPSSSTDAQ
jgi:acetyltransferase-like isoleucine patch superfamily enzyme